MPSTIVSYGFRKRVPSASAFAYSTPRVTCPSHRRKCRMQTEGLNACTVSNPVVRLVPLCHVRSALANDTQHQGHAMQLCMRRWCTLLYRLEPGGSTSTTLVLGSCRFKTCDTPAMVPPVPAPATNACSLPAVWATISDPASSSGLFQ